MKRLICIFMIFLTDFQLCGCIGADIVHTKQIAYGNIGDINGAEKTTKNEAGGGFRWAGIYLSLIVPIPLIVPVGRETRTQWIKNNKVVYQELLVNEASGGGCAILYGCGSRYTWAAYFLESHSYM